MFDSLPKGSQVKLWYRDMTTKKVGDTVPDFGLDAYVVLLREGGYVLVEKGVITQVLEEKLYFSPLNFPDIVCFDKWGAQLFGAEDLTNTGLLGNEDYYFDRHTQPGAGE